MAEKTNVIEIAVPARNTAADWNLEIATKAAAAGIEMPVPGAGVKEVPAAKTEDEKEETIYRASVNIDGKDLVFEHKDPAVVLQQFQSAVEAAQLAAAPPVKKEEPAAPALTEAELFDISLKIQKGDLTALDAYIDKSGLIDRLLQNRGIDPATLRQDTAERRSEKVITGWQEATADFIKQVAAGEIDYPGGEQNMQVMGMMIAKLGLGDKPSVESFKLAYAEMKKQNLVFPVAPGADSKTEGGGGTKKPPGSTAVGTGGADKRGAAAPAVDPNRKFELDLTQLKPHEYTQAWNQLIAAGVKPEQIVLKQ